LRLNETPRCGKCHQDLFSAQPLELRSDNFSKHVSRNDIPVVVDFWAPWCGPCKMMAPAFEQAEQAIAAQYSIRSIPTMIVFRGGREVARQPGAMGAPDIVNWVRSHIRG